MRSLIAGLVLFASVGSLEAQIPIPIPTLPELPGDPSDTVEVAAFRVDPPISPLGALWRSMLIPGWGQATLGRRVTGAAFVLWEGVTVTMMLKAQHQLGYLERTGSNNVEAKKAEVQDWAVLLVFNHLMAGAEAFVAGMLWDFPGELEAGVTPQGDVQVGMRYYFK